MKFLYGGLVSDVAMVNWPVAIGLFILGFFLHTTGIINVSLPSLDSIYQFFVFILPYYAVIVFFGFLNYFINK